MGDFVLPATKLWEKALEIGLAGGPAMIGIGAVARLMFGLGAHVLLNLRSVGYGTIPESAWRRWVRNPDEGLGRIGAIIRSISPGQFQRETDLVARCRLLFASETMPIERDLKVMRILVAAAPLVGLLGTVMGMLVTFDALAFGSGGEKTMGLIARGISEALITTKTGLVVALPGLFFHYLISRRALHYQAFLSHLETVCVQDLHRNLGLQERARLEKLAAHRIARGIPRRLEPPSV